MGELLSLIEPVPVEDDYVTALATVEDCGPLARLVFYVRTTCYETREPVCVVRRKLVLCWDELPNNWALINRRLSERRRAPLRLV